MWTALIAAGAAILSSILTSYLTHHFERRRRERDHELRWLEERFGPALEFLGKVLAIVSNAPHTQDGYARVREEIHNIVTGSSKESNAWYIATLLDPEGTGLGEHIHSAMTYARIAESAEEFLKYQARLHLNLKTLAEEFRRERQAIVAGKSLESLIQKRKSELDKNTHELEAALQAVRAFVEGKAELNSTLVNVKRSNVRDTKLDWVFEIVASGDDPEKRTRLKELRSECDQRSYTTPSNKASVNG